VVSENGEPLRFGSDEIRGKAQLETRPFPKLGAIGLGEGGYVTNVQLAEDAERVAHFFREHGFPQVRVRPEVARDPASFAALGALGAETAGGLGGANELWVRFMVDPGREELIETVDVAFDGPHIKSERDIQRVLRLKPGVPYTDDALKEEGHALAKLYRSSG